MLLQVIKVTTEDDGIISAATTITLDKPEGNKIFIVQMIRSMFPGIGLLDAKKIMDRFIADAEATMKLRNIEAQRAAIANPINTQVTVDYYRAEDEYRQYTAEELDNQPF